MAHHFSALLLSLALIAAFIGASRPHIIGGSINTKRYRYGPVNSVLRSVISNIASSRSGASVQGDTSNDISLLTNGDQDSSDVAEDFLSALSSSVDNQLVRVRLPPAAFSRTNQINPFTRRKRQACSAIAGSILDELISKNNTKMFIGHIPPSGDETVPANQSSECPTSMNSTSPLERLRSNCPWNLTRRNLTRNSYPSYVVEAKCLCDKCVGTPKLYSCIALTAPKIYFQLIGCQGNLALLVKKTTQVKVGCFCAAPQRNGST
ncbi:hypothetical protein BsWGS_07522 [Bradybaena similaris]